MTVDERFEQLERKTQRLEKRNKRLTVALTMMVVAMAAVVTMAATGDKDAEFDTVRARNIFLINDAGSGVVILGADYMGNGHVYTQSANGRPLVTMSTSPIYDAKLRPYGSEHAMGSVTLHQPNGKELVALRASDNGGAVYVSNKTGDTIATLKADEYGNGVVGAWNRKGKGRTLQPGP